MNEIKKFFKKFVRKAKNTLGIYQAPDGVIILLYHRINDDLPDSRYVVRAKTFAAQMKFIAENPQTYTVIGLKDLETNRPRIYNTRFPKTKIIITFDDGYQDNYANAWPVLKKFNFPATIFLTTGMIGTDRKFGRYQAQSGRDMLSWDEVREMGKGGITFGAHTVSHPHLLALGLEEQKKEIAPSISELKKELPSSQVIQSFCYPYGEFNADTLKILKELGVPSALGVERGVNTPYTDLHNLMRIEVIGADTIKGFEYKILEKYSHIPEQNIYREYPPVGRG